MYLFPIEPQTGESLSSWRQQQGWANGYRIFPLSDERFRRRDQDQLPLESEIAFLLQRARLERANILALTPQSKSWLPRDAWGRLHQGWWLAPQYSGKGKTSASVFCTMCLGEQSPYFRLEWRFAYSTVCGRHGVLMRDRCINCDAPAWPAAASICASPHGSFDSFRRCARCGEDLAAAPRTLVSTPGWQPPRADENGFVQVGSQAVNTSAYMGGARQLLQFMLRRCRMKENVTQLERLAPFLELQETSLPDVRAFEHLPVASRHMLLECLAKLLSDWPATLISVCRRAGVLRYELTSTSALADWIRTPIEAQLPGQNRKVTPEKLKETYDGLPAASRTKTSLRQKLGWSGDKGLDLLFPPKRPATADERAALLSELASPTAARRSHFARTLNRGALICALADRMPLKYLEKHRPSAVCDWLIRLGSSEAQILEFADSMRRLLASHPLAQDHFYSIRELASCLRESIADCGAPSHVAWLVKDSRLDDAAQQEHQ